MNKYHLAINSRKSIVISDVHGSTYWKEFIKQRRPEDQVIFLGDYFDRRGAGPFASTDVQNFMEICAYARHTPQTYLLVGNHDYDYLPFASWLPRPWGRREQENRDALMANIDLLEMVYVTNGIIFSHGGLTQTFLNENSLSHPGEVNELWLMHPEAFDFKERDPISGQWSNRYGDDPWQSPIWIRTESLIEDGVKGFDQVVGHTPVRTPEVMETIHGDKFLLTCTLDDTLIRLGA